jgi:hypothetical protein
MKKSFPGNIFLLVCSVIVTLIVAEFIFRWMLFGNARTFKSLREPSYYSNYIRHVPEDFYDEDYWKLNYIFKKKFKNEDPHPLLGWTVNFNKKTFIHNDSNKVGNKRPVLLYGNSFAMCVYLSKCFEEILNNDKDFAKGHYLLNYGVGGYGVDQIYLLLNETVDKFNKPFVVFSLLTTDMDRCMLSVRDAQKPYFVETDSGLKLQGVPITLASSEYFKKNRPKIKSYLFNKFRNSALNPFKNDERREKEYIEKIKSINKLILNKIFERLRESEIDFVVLLFHPVRHEKFGWRSLFLINYFYANDVPYIYDLELRERDTTYSTYNPDNYAIRNDGHPTTHSNTLISNEIKRYILDFDYRKTVLARNRERKDIATSQVEYYKYIILNSPDWLEKVKSKAIEKGISLDSMLLLDAEYMVRIKKEEEEAR